MLGKQIVHSLDRYLKVILQMAWLNVLWFIFTLLGLVIGGVFPATTSAMSVAQKWLQDGKINSTYPTFKKTYKTEFKKSNFIGFSKIGRASCREIVYIAELAVSVKENTTLNQ